MKIGSRLAEARRQKDINQTDMADLLGVTTPTYSRLERNETSIDINQIVRFAEILDIPIQEFLPETVALHNTNNQSSQGGLIFGNIYTYNYSDKELQQENNLLNEKKQFTQ
jgi:transcriptional regulator with XRE-family HTH domain